MSDGMGPMIEHGIDALQEKWRRFKLTPGERVNEAMGSVSHRSRSSRSIMGVWEMMLDEYNRSFTHYMDYGFNAMRLTWAPYIDALNFMSLDYQAPEFHWPKKKGAPEETPFERWLTSLTEANNHRR